jgi:hypothetical protein
MAKSTKKNLNYQVFIMHKTTENIRLRKTPFHNTLQKISDVSGSSLTCTRIMFSLFRYIFSLSITFGSDDVLMIKPTMYFFMPENKIL